MCNGFFGVWRRKCNLPLCFLFSAALVHPQQTQVELNTYYQFPLSVGVEYRSMTSFSAYPSGSPYNLYDLSLNVRWPISSLPVLQPLLRTGMMRSRTYYQMENYDQAKGYYGKAQLVDAHGAGEFAYLAESKDTGAQAAEERDPRQDILFVGE